MFGFGAGLIAVGGLALFLPDIQDAVVLVLLVNLLAELVVVYRDRRHIRFQGVLSMALAIGLGIPIGTWLLKCQAPYALLTGLGVVL